MHTTNCSKTTQPQLAISTDDKWRLVVNEWTKCLVQYSTGAGSAEVALRMVEKYGTANVHLISADTAIEDDDNWRFAQQVWEFLERPAWSILRDGRTPMQVGRDKRIVPNNRIAVCSRVLKREPIRKFMDAIFDPERHIVALGFDWTEEHRLSASIEPWKPWTICAPLMEPTYLQKADILDAWRKRGFEPPRLYEMGFAHANCGGGCVRSGMAQWSLLLRTMPDRYSEWEQEEEATRELLGKDVSILKRSIRGVATPVTLRQFRQEEQSQPTLFGADDWGACGCFTVADYEQTNSEAATAGDQH